eukprot:5061734-Alexandrium_andersonii.AAC.1
MSAPARPRSCASSAWRAPTWTRVRARFMRLSSEHRCLKCWPEKKEARTESGWGGRKPWRGQPHQASSHPPDAEGRQEQGHGARGR